MNWLPIAERELRVAARKPGTFWVRLAAALLALLIGSGFFVVSALRQTSLAQMGSILFTALAWMALVAALSAGLFFTSDCLSEEKREGTLGLLFVTHLRGYDVVSGKLLATSLRGFYALLALLPVLAVTLLMGGVSAGQYWKTSLALLNGLFVSLAAGVFVSALSRDPQKALAATLLLLLVLAAAGPLADAITAGLKKRPFSPNWSLTSPGYVMVTAGAWGRARFWPALLLTHLLGWVLFGLACWFVPHAWQERKRAGVSSTNSWNFAWRYGGVRRRARLRRKLLEWQPLAWLACRECWQSRVLWGLAGILVAGFVVVLSENVPQEVWLIWSYLGGLFMLLIYVWAASQASRTLVEARRSGLLELLLVTPASVRQIVGGQWRGLWRLFGIPVILLIGMHVVGVTFAQLSVLRLTAQAAAVSSSASTNTPVVVTNRSAGGRTSYTVVSTNTTTTYSVSVRPFSARSSIFKGGATVRQVAVAVTAALTAGLSTAANLIALGWFGMWMGLTSKTANQATLKTLLFVQVIPWFAIAFAAAMAVPLLLASMAFRSGPPQGSFWLTWWPLLNAALAALLAIGKDIAFMLWSRKRLLFAFRDQATRPIGVAAFAPPRERSCVPPALGPGGSPSA